MGRASVTLGAPDSSAGVMDGFIIGTHRFRKGSERTSCFGVDRIGKAVSEHEATAVVSQQQQETQEEVTLSRLWFELPLDERTKFGNCFSRMLLKCLNDTTQQEQEVLK